MLISLLTVYPDARKMSIQSHYIRSREAKSSHDSQAVSNLESSQKLSMPCVDGLRGRALNLFHGEKY